MLLHAGVKGGDGRPLVFGSDSCKPEGEQCDATENDYRNFADKGGSRFCEFPEQYGAGDACNSDGGKKFYACNSRLFIYNPEKPANACKQQDAHYPLQMDHPHARFRENFKYAGEGTHQHIGEGKTKACCAKEQEQDWRGLREGEPHGGTQEGSGTGSAQEHQERTRKERSRKSGFLACAVHLGGGAPGEPDFKDSEKAHGKSGQDDHHEGDKACALELHPPARGPAAGLDGGDNGGQHPETHQDARRCGSSQGEEPSAAFSRLFDQAEQL